MVGSNSVFISYASPDGSAAARIGDALRAAGIEVWLDPGEPRGDEVQDPGSRQRIRDCALFLPVISANAGARSEGAFRLEWKLAIDRSQQMAGGRPFLVPVVIDDTQPAQAPVPDRFHDSAWRRLPGGETSPAFVTRVLALLQLTRVESDTTAATGAAPTDEPSHARTPAHRFLWTASMAGLLLLAGIAVTLALRSHPLVPYSGEDRRMTFAVLPFTAPAGVTDGRERAAADTDAARVALERNVAWARAADRAETDQAAARFSGARDIARALGVHFLVRGTVSRSNDGYSIELGMLDGETGQSLGSATVIEGDGALPTSTQDYDTALADLIYRALQAEVLRVRMRAEWELDVRDLTWRAYVYYYRHVHAQPRDAYETAERLLERALHQSPDDSLALHTTAQINLCDCLNGWMQDTRHATQIGAAAVDKLARLDVRNPPYRLRLRALQLQGRWAEMLATSDQALRGKPDNLEFLSARILALMHLGRASESLAITPVVERRNVHHQPGYSALIADAEYAAGLYAPAMRHAQAALASMNADSLRSPVEGPIRLTLAAAQARLGKQDAARASLEAFWMSVPEARTLTAVNRWMYPSANLYGFAPLAEGLRLAGVPD